GLGGVHLGVGGSDDGLHAVAILGEGGEAEASGQREVEARAREEALIAESLPKLHGGVDGGLLAQARQQRDELVASVAEAQVVRPENPLHQAANLGEQAASDQMAVRIVDLFEVVEVDEEQAELVAAVGG